MSVGDDKQKESVVDAQSRKHQHLKNKERSKVMCSHVQHPPTHRYDTSTHAAHDLDLNTTKYNKRTLKRPSEVESQDRLELGKRGVCKE